MSDIIKNIGVAFTAIKAELKTLADNAKASVFDKAAQTAALTAALSGSLSADEINKMVEFAEKKHNEKHGDNADNVVKCVLSGLAPALGGIETLSLVAGQMAKEERRKGLVVVTASEFKTALEGGEGADAKHTALLARIEAARKATPPAPWSKLETDLKLAGSTRAAVYSVIRDGGPDVHARFNYSPRESANA